MKAGYLRIAAIGRGYIHRLDEVEIIGPSMRVDHEYWVKKVGCSKKVGYMSTELMTHKQILEYEVTYHPKGGYGDTDERKVLPGTKEYEGK